MEQNTSEMERHRLVMAFGKAQIFKLLGGQYEVHGGSDKERQQAFEWLNRFHPEISDPSLIPQFKHSSQAET